MPPNESPAAIARAFSTATHMVVSGMKFDFKADLWLAMFSLGIEAFFTDARYDSLEAPLAAAYSSWVCTARNRLARWSTSTEYANAVWSLHRPSDTRHPVVVAREIAATAPETRLPPEEAILVFTHALVRAAGSYERARDAIRALAEHLTQEQRDTVSAALRGAVNLVSRHSSEEAALARQMLDEGAQ